MTERAGLNGKPQPKNRLPRRTIGLIQLFFLGGDEKVFNGYFPSPKVNDIRKEINKNAACLLNYLTRSGSLQISLVSQQGHYDYGYTQVRC